MKYTPKVALLDSGITPKNFLDSLVEEICCNAWHDTLDKKPYT